MPKRINKHKTQIISIADRYSHDDVKSVRRRQLHIDESFIEYHAQKLGRHAAVQNPEPTRLSGSLIFKIELIFSVSPHVADRNMGRAIIVVPGSCPIVDIGL